MEDVFPSPPLIFFFARKTFHPHRLLSRSTHRFSACECVFYCVCFSQYQGPEGTTWDRLTKWVGVGKATRSSTWFTARAIKGSSESASLSPPRRRRRCEHVSLLSNPPFFMTSKISRHLLSIRPSLCAINSCIICYQIFHDFFPDQIWHHLSHASSYSVTSLLIYHPKLHRLLSHISIYDPNISVVCY